MAARELDPTTRAGSSISSVETVAHRVLAEAPFAALVVGHRVFGLERIERERRDLVD